jgi:hypothetical protein
MKEVTGDGTINVTRSFIIYKILQQRVWDTQDKQVNEKCIQNFSQNTSREDQFGDQGTDGKNTLKYL